MRLKFLGAAGMVTGSCYLLDGRILIDLGMFQGTEEVAKHNYEPLDFDPERVDSVIVTHAHLDHCGRLPLLAQRNFGGQIFMTEASRELVEIVLLDCAKLSREDREKVPLYNEEEVAEVLTRVKTVGYDEEFDLGGGFIGRLVDAGHILGSASVEITKEGRKIVFSGDLGNSPQDLIRPTEYIKQGEMVVMESTYGDRLHGIEDPKVTIAEEIKAVEKSGGTLLIPAFSLERTQELLHILDHLKKAGEVKADVKVYLDSPMAIRTTEVFKRHEELYNRELKGHRKNDDPFDFPGLVIVENGRESRKIKLTKGAKVIIAGSGMMTGGRMIQHAEEFLPQETTRLLFVGYQAVGTLGRRVLGGQKKVYINGQEIEVRAQIREVTSMSAHADQAQLLKWLEQIKGVRQVFLTHGEEGRLVLAEKIKTDLQLPVRMPVLGEEFAI